MSSSIQGCVKSYVSTVAIAAYVLVKKSGDNVVVLDTPATDVAIGVTLANGAAGDRVPVRLLNAGGTVLIKAGVAIAQNASVYTAATGVIGTTNTNALVGYAEQAAAVGDIIEVLTAL